MNDTLILEQSAHSLKLEVSLSEMIDILFLYYNIEVRNSNAICRGPSTTIKAKRITVCLNL